MSSAAAAQITSNVQSACTVVRIPTPVSLHSSLGSNATPPRSVNLAMTACSIRTPEPQNACKISPSLSATLFLKLEVRVPSTQQFAQAITISKTPNPSTSTACPPTDPSPAQSTATSQELFAYTLSSTTPSTSTPPSPDLSLPHAGSTRITSHTAQSATATSRSKTTFEPFNLSSP